MPTDARRIISKLFIIPQRYVLGIMCCIGAMITYTERYGFRVILLFLSVPANTTQMADSCVTKKAQYNSTATEIDDKDRYNWGEEDLHLLENSFYWFYSVTQIFGGIFADQYGAKYIMSIPIFLIMMIHFVTPSIIIWSGGNRNVLITIRTIMGLIEGLIFPSMYSILAQWVPKCERTFIASLSLTGMSLGKGVANSVTKWIIGQTNMWSSAYYLFGLMSLVWFIIWNLICYSSPQTHPFISDREKEYLKRKLDGHVFLGRKKIPWWSMLISQPVWATILVQFGQGWMSFAMISKLSVFVKIMFRINPEENMLMDSIPYFCLFPFCLICAFFCDLIANRNYLTITTIRKVLTTVGSMGPAIYISAATLLECNQDATLGLFCVAMVLNSAFIASSNLNSIDLAPNFAGTLKGIVNTFAEFLALTGPEADFHILGDPNQREVEEWRMIFLAALIIMALTNFAYVLIGNSEEQIWNKLELKREERPTDLNNSMLYTHNND